MQMVTRMAVQTESATEVFKHICPHAFAIRRTCGKAESPNTKPAKLPMHRQAQTVRCFARTVKQARFPRIKGFSCLAGPTTDLGLPYFRRKARKQYPVWNDTSVILAVFGHSSLHSKVLPPGRTCWCRSASRFRTNDAHPYARPSPTPKSSTANLARKLAT